MEGESPTRASRPAGAVFLSYPSQDAAAAQRICAALRAAGIEVWFDQSELRGGDVWDALIRDRIRACEFFVPVISSTTNARDEGYFRREWRLAIERTADMADDKPFLVPVVIDGTTETSARVPEAFRKVQWTRLPDGQCTKAFVDRLLSLTAMGASPTAEGRARAPSSFAGAARQVGRPEKIRTAWRVLAVATVVALLAVGLAFLAHELRRLLTTGAADAILSDKSVAVLPFENRSRDHAQDFYADGLTDELTTALSRISGLKVIARNSAARYRGSDKRPSEIAHDLGVAALVTGSVLRAGGHVRYTAALVSADTERNLWVESYDRDEHDVLALQSEVARAIARAIAVRISPGESERLADQRPVDPQAFDEYLLGRALWNQRTEQGIRAALTHFENATRLAPELALAYTGIADSHILLGVYGFDPPRSAFPKAKAAALRAIELDPHAGEPHASLGDILFHYEWDWRGSEREHETAIGLAPAYATAYQWGAEAQILNGDLAGALARLQRARTLDPYSMVIRYNLANVLKLLGRREQAIAELRAAIALDPNFARTRWELARQLLALGRTGDALTEARKLAELAPDNTPAIAVLGLCLGRASDAQGARTLLKRLEGWRSARFISSLELARIAAGLRDRDRTLGYLEQAIDAREGFLPFIGGDDEFAFLHDDSRFVDITRKIGIAPVPSVAPTRSGDGR
ncbi:MAG: TIR domain-containing protein [Alphaproteobacteria bacterium]|nr:TIR domain-containing protein [Alphaproteobacteria bacterium]